MPPPSAVLPAVPPPSGPQCGKWLSSRGAAREPEGLGQSLCKLFLVTSAGMVSGHRSASGHQTWVPLVPSPQSHPCLWIPVGSGGKVAPPGLEGAPGCAGVAVTPSGTAKPGGLRGLGWVVSESPVCKIRPGTAPGLERLCFILLREGGLWVGILTGEGRTRGP